MHRPSLPRRWCVCVIPGSTCPQLCSSLGIVALVTLVHREGGPRPQALCGGCPAVHRSGGHHSAPHCALGCERGPSHLEKPWEEQQLLELPTSVPQCRGCLAAGMCWDGSPWYPQGMQHSRCGTLRKGFSGKEKEGSATLQVRCGSQPPPAPWQSPFPRAAELPLSTERGLAAALPPYQHLRPARWPLQLHAPPPSPAGSGDRDSPKQPSPPWQPESHNRTRHVLAARHIE